MRRLIAYITTALSMLLAIGVAATPVVTNLKTGREFTSNRNYREVVFTIEENEDDRNNKTRSSVVAEEMRQRLNNYHIEDYSIKVQGEDTVTVSMDLDSTEFNYVAKYLSFSGESFALVASNDSKKNEHKLFNPADVRLEHKDDVIPVIYIPLTAEGKKDVQDLIKELNDGDDSSKSIKRSRAIEAKADGEEEEGSSEAQKAIYLWANLDESNNEGMESFNVDPISVEKVLMAFNADNIWNTDPKKDAESELIYYCAGGTKEDPSQLDTQNLEAFNKRANFLVAMLKASKYNFKVSCPKAAINGATKSVDYFTNATVLDASAESLTVFNNNKNIKMSKTFIATMIAIVIVSLLLVVYYRLSALAMVATSLGTLFLTLVSFSTMSVIFNVPAVVGFIILASGSLFGEIVYVNRFKEEIYKGRSIKKANQEASKKSNLLTLDSSIVLAFSGLMMYALGQSALKPMGAVLFFGAIFSLLMNLLVFKLLMYLMSNSTNLQNKYNVFNIDGEKVPNLMSSTEEKPSYEAPYEKVNFTKRKSIFSIIFGALSAAALTCIIVFGATSSNKSPLNVEKAVADKTVVYTSIQIDGESSIINDAALYKEYILKDPTDANDQTKAMLKDLRESNVDFVKVTNDVYNAGEDKTDAKPYYYVTITLDKSYKASELEALQTALNNNLSDKYESSLNSDVTYATVRNSKELVYTPSQGYVALATGIAIVGISLYAAFRFRPSRGIAMFVTTVGATTIAYGVMVGLHFIGTTAITSVAMPIVAITMMLASLFYFSTEKAMFKESKENLTPEVRKEIMIKALGKSASPMFIFMLVSIYVVINFFGFGVQGTALLFASALIGDIVAIGVLLTVAGPFAELVAKGLGKIRLPIFKFLQKNAKPKETRRNSSEPEETIFIGIND